MCLEIQHHNALRKPQLSVCKDLLSELKINKQIDVLCLENILFYFILFLNFGFGFYYMKNHSHLDLFLLKDQAYRDEN